jgi:hypothetical protein
MPEDTRLVSTLPNLTMEILHRQDPEGGAEHLFLHLTATPSFPAVLDSPLALWSAMTQAMLAPWTAAAAGGVSSGMGPWLAPWVTPWLALGRPDTSGPGPGA